MVMNNHFRNTKEILLFSWLYVLNISNLYLYFPFENSTIFKGGLNDDLHLLFNTYANKKFVSSWIIKLLLFFKVTKWDGSVDMLWQ